MHNGNIKERDVMSFENFAKAYDKAKDVVQLPKGKDAHPQTHKIQGDPLFYRHDANVYRAAGIPIDEEQANMNDRVVPGHDPLVTKKPHDGQDPLPGAKIVKGQDVTGSKEEKAEEKAAKTYADAADVAHEEIKKKNA